MSRRVSSLNSTAVGIDNEINSQYTNVKIVADQIATVEVVADNIAEIIAAARVIADGIIVHESAVTAEHVLPAAVVSAQHVIIATGNTAQTVTPAEGNRFMLINGSLTTLNASLVCAAYQGSLLQLIAINSTTWLVTSIRGSWTEV